MQMHIGIQMGIQDADAWMHVQIHMVHMMQIHTYSDSDVNAYRQTVDVRQGATQILRRQMQIQIYNEIQM